MATLTKSDKAVIAAFVKARSASGRLLSTNGRTLSLHGLGGGTVAFWSGDPMMSRGRGRMHVEFPQASTRLEQQVQRAVTKALPTNSRNPRRRNGDAHIMKKGSTTYADSGVLQSLSSVGIALDHIGFGDFKAFTPNGEVYFARVSDVDIPGQHGRAHRMDGPEDAIRDIVAALSKHGQLADPRPLFPGGSRKAAAPKKSKTSKAKRAWTASHKPSVSPHVAGQELAFTRWSKSKKNARRNHTLTDGELHGLEMLRFGGTGMSGVNQRLVAKGLATRSRGGGYQATLAGTTELADRAARKRNSRHYRDYDEAFASAVAAQLPSWASRAQKETLLKAAARGRPWGWLGGSGMHGSAGGATSEARAKAAASKWASQQARASGGPRPWTSIIHLGGSEPRSRNARGKPFIKPGGMVDTTRPRYGAGRKQIKLAHGRAPIKAVLPILRKLTGRKLTLKDTAVTVWLQGHSGGGSVDYDIPYDDDNWQLPGHVAVEVFHALVAAGAKPTIIKRNARPVDWLGRGKYGVPPVAAITWETPKKMKGGVVRYLRGGYGGHIIEIRRAPKWGAYLIYIDGVQRHMGDTTGLSLKAVQRRAAELLQLEPGSIKLA